MLGISAILVVNLVYLTLGLFNLEQQKTDSAVINDTGKLRMLSQKIAKATFLFANGDLEAREELIATAQVFEKTFNGVRYGNPERGITPPPVAVQDQIETVSQIWELYMADVTKISKLNPGDPELSIAAQGIKDRNLLLLKEANAAVQLFEKEAQTKLADLMNMMLILSGFAVLVFLFTLYILRKSLKPISVLVEATAQVESGDTTVNIPVSGKDELSQLSRSFNSMVESLHKASQIASIEKETTFAEKRKAETLAQESEQQRQFLAHHIKYMLSRFERFADGDLTVRLEMDRDDKDDEQISSLYKGFNKALENLGEMIEEIKALISHSEHSITLIAGATEELAVGVQDHTLEIANAASSVENITAEIINNASQASHTVSVAQENGNVARRGGEVVSATVEKIQDIARIVEDSSKKVSLLGKSSKDIGDIVSTITDIADQTNLLALNAAIEAARAGEQGRGFAVVADEVRSLAERTTDATQQIATMIKTIQAETSQAVSAMKHGNEEVQKGLSLADEAGDALGIIVDQTTETVGLIDKIGKDNAQQSENCLQVSETVSRIAAVIEESSRGLSEISESTQQLNLFVGSLSEFIARFKVQAPIDQTNLAIDTVTENGFQHVEG